MNHLSNILVRMDYEALAHEAEDAAKRHEETAEMLLRNVDTLSPQTQKLHLSLASLERSHAAQCRQSAAEYWGMAFLRKRSA